MGKKLFVGNLSFNTTNAELTDFFSRVGNCESASVIMDRATGRSRGFGFVEMGSPSEAQEAISQLNGQELQGRTVNVSEAREREGGGGGGGFGGGRDRDRRGGGGGFDRRRTY
jgi:RNA recognition motif-containing protein